MTQLVYMFVVRIHQRQIISHRDTHKSKVNNEKLAFCYILITIYFLVLAKNGNTQLFVGLFVHCPCWPHLTHRCKRYSPHWQPLWWQHAQSFRVVLKAQTHPDGVNVYQSYLLAGACNTENRKFWNKYAEPKIWNIKSFICRYFSF